MRLLAHTGLLLVLTIPVAAEPPSKRPLAVEDLYRFDGPRSVVVAPDGERAVFVRQWIDPTAKQERFSLWRSAGKAGAAAPLEKGEPDARHAVFSPDGKWIAILSTRSRPDGWKQTPAAPSESDPATDVWLLPANGGDAIPLAGADKPYGRVFNDGFYGRLAFSPDSKRLAFVADDGKPLSREEIAARVRVVRVDQGEGYTGYGPAQIWVAQLAGEPDKSAAARIDRLTKDDVWYGDPQWTPDGKSLVVHANRSDDRESVRYSINKNYDLWMLDATTGTRRQLTTGPGPEVSPRISADGKRILCLSVPRKGTHRDVFNLAVLTLGESGPRTEILFDHHGPRADSPPHLPPSFPLPEDCWDGSEHAVYRAEDGVRTATLRLHLPTGRASPLESKADAEMDSFAGRQHLRQQFSPPGNGFLRERTLAEGRVVNWGNEGLKLDGIFTPPTDSAAQPPYKLVVYPHGGPHSRSALGFDFTVQTFAANGYAVFQPNFRGSSGYGQKFIDADRGDFGGGDMRDVLSGVDHLVKEKLVDPDRQFVYGTSYGGFMTCWLIGHTHQFRAAVAQNAVTDLNAMWGLSDLQSWTEWEFGGKPWEVPDAMRRHSPLTYASSVKTPTLILHSRDDRRCPLPMGQMFHQALRDRRVPTAMVIYPGEGHGIRQPRHREDVLRRTLEWFNRHDRK